MASFANQSVSKQILEAVVNGNLTLVKRLVSKLNNERTRNIITNAKDCNGRMALHVAALGGKTHICKYLIKQVKIDINIKDEEGNTPLLHAILGDHFLTIHFLLESGADPNTSDADNLTGLHHAATKGHAGLIRLLISRGAVVDAEMVRGTPLLLATSHGRSEAVKILLEHNANPNRIFSYVHTPLIIAIIEKSYECVRILLEAKADPNLGPSGVTPLEMAVSDGEIDIVKWLLKAGADPNAVNAYGETPLETAALLRNKEMVSVLLSVTSRNPKVLDWSSLGIIEHVYSNEVREERNLKRKEHSRFAKKKGEEEFKKKSYLHALYFYTEALEASRDDPVAAAILLSNRSVCHIKMNRGDEALSDAQECLGLRPDWPKAYYRVGAALKLQKKYGEAAEAFTDGLKLDPNNEDLQAARKEALLEQVKDVCTNKYGFVVTDSGIF